MTLQKAPTSTDAVSPHATEGSSPRHEVTVQSDFDLPKNLQFNVVYRYVSALPGEGVAAYSTADARFSWHVRPAFEVALAGRNLFQPSHVEAAGDPATLVGIVRSGYVKLTWTHRLFSGGGLRLP
jgi:iron complex outermembrane receptor protein